MLPTPVLHSLALLMRLCSLCVLQATVAEREHDLMEMAADIERKDGVVADLRKKIEASSAGRLLAERQLAARNAELEEAVGIADEHAAELHVAREARALARRQVRCQRRRCRRHLSPLLQLLPCASATCWGCAKRQLDRSVHCSALPVYETPF